MGNTLRANDSDHDVDDDDMITLSLRRGLNKEDIFEVDLTARPWSWNVLESNFGEASYLPRALFEVVWNNSSFTCMVPFPSPELEASAAVVVAVDLLDSTAAAAALLFRAASGDEPSSSLSLFESSPSSSPDSTSLISTTWGPALSVPGAGAGASPKYFSKSVLASPLSSARSSSTVDSSFTSRPSLLLPSSPEGSPMLVPRSASSLSSSASVFPSFAAVSGLPDWLPASFPSLFCEVFFPLSAASLSEGDDEDEDEDFLFFFFLAFFFFLDESLFFSLWCSFSLCPLSSSSGFSVVVLLRFRDLCRRRCRRDRDLFRFSSSFEPSSSSLITFFSSNSSSLCFTSSSTAFFSRSSWEVSVRASRGG
mmetsp:Transcript_66419/g.144194  ORF Transcript_66419/g.144194 Transcript_66419/m.144194 type:complete len:366 (+) Transcript_66419:108-1205(+)